MLFDCHSHVQFSAFEKDWKEVIDRTLAGGVSIINVGTQRDTSAKAVEIANIYKDGVYATIALHPVHTTRSFHDSQELGPSSPEASKGQAAFTPKGFMSRAEKFDYAYYLNLAKDKKVVGLGECGLDYFRPTGDLVEYKKLQKDVFIQHVKIAQEVGKALMIHCRPSKGTDDAYEDLLEILKEMKFPAERAVLHFYVGSPAMTKKFLDAGFNFEFGGVITFARSYDEQIKLVPLDRILTETDAPYVAPEPHRGERNEPLYVKEVAKKLAEIKGVSYDELERMTSSNARRIFKIPLSSHA